MRKGKSFRPLSVDNLEDRMVPSGFGFGGFGGGVNGFVEGGGFGRFAGLMIASVPAQDARFLAQAFQTFTQGYANAVSTTPPSAGLPAFDAAVSTLVTTLNQNIQSVVTAAKLPSATTGALSTLTTKLANDIIAPPTNVTRASLQDHLAALTTPAAPTG